MRCEKLRRIYFKYIDGELSQRRARLVEKHVRDCPDCATEAKSIEEMRSILHTAAEIELPDAYWDTYWDRLKKKLPDEPSLVSVTSRISAAAVSLFRRPAVLGRAAIYILFLAFLIYTTPYRLVKVAPKTAAISAPASSTIAVAENKMRPHGLAGGSLPKQKRKVAELSTETAKIEKTAGKAFLRAAPAKPAPAPEELLVEVRDHPQGIADSADEYVAGDNYFKKGDYTQAITAYQNFVDANVQANVGDERILRAVYQIGEANYQAGNYSEALSNFAVVTNEKVPETFGIEADRLIRARTKSVMVSKLEEAKESDLKTERRAANRGMGALYYNRQRDKIPSRTREELISQAVFRQAESYEHLEKHEEALAKYREYVEKYPRGKYVPQAKEKIAQIGRY